MAKKTRKTQRNRRHLRVRRYIHGSPERPRLNVYRSLKEIYAQVIDDELGHTLASASTLDPEIKGQLDGLSKVEQAEIVGKAIGERAMEKGIDTVVFDRGGFRYFGRVKAVAEGARKAGLKF